MTCDKCGIRETERGEDLCEECKDENDDDEDDDYDYNKNKEIEKQISKNQCKLMMIPPYTPEWNKVAKETNELEKHLYPEEIKNE